MFIKFISIFLNSIVLLMIFNISKIELSIKLSTLNSIKQNELRLKIMRNTNDSIFIPIIFLSNVS